jgi:hypothetical protein
LALWGQRNQAKIYGFFNIEEVDLGVEEGRRRRQYHHYPAVDIVNDDEIEETDLEVERINLDYSFRPINSPPEFQRQREGYPYQTNSISVSTTLPRSNHRQQQRQEQQQVNHTRRNSTGSYSNTKNGSVAVASNNPVLLATSTSTMAGLNDYNQSRQPGGYYGYYDQTQQQGQSAVVAAGPGVVVHQDDIGYHHPPAAVGVGVGGYSSTGGQSGRTSSRGGEYYGGNRATSPYSLQQGGGVTSYSPRLAGHHGSGQFYGGIGDSSYSSEGVGGNSSRPSTRNFNLSFNSPTGISPTESPPEGCSYLLIRF